METSKNEWNSAYWIDHLVKMTNEKPLNATSILEKSIDSSTMTSSPSMSSTLKSGLLIDVSDPNSLPPPSPVTREISIKLSDFEDSNDEQPTTVGEPDISFSQMMASRPEKMVVVEAEQINCSLTDLVLGTKSSIIRDAYSLMDDQIRRSAYITDKSSTITFASLVEEAKQQKKPSFNVNASEFKPSFNKQ
jgi:hypothetical protein